QESQNLKCVEEDKRIYIKAAILHIMYTPRKALWHQQLCSANCVYFPPELKVIKRMIEVLFERSYMCTSIGPLTPSTYRHL
ncbi:hypothetical protein JKP88DRAFT_134589, partial [Tribonema minus]